ncbi:MAG: flavin reductase family protein [Coriobacteriales bacterium]|jgi:flavin reductase (DIM6/NTAB) family NADH-FMN oxidoreductase RutF|nr:flavin reductase family protein [Coriobacteriales bacterium]
MALLHSFTGHLCATIDGNNRNGNAANRRGPRGTDRHDRAAATIANEEATMKKSLGAESIIFPNPVLVVGTYDITGKANAVTLAWGGIACSNPPAVSIAVRPSRHSHEALVRTKAFTVNLPSVEQAAYADYFGIVSGRDVDKFRATGLTPVRGERVDAPYIEEFPYNLECKVTHSLELGTHTLFIGEVVDVKIDQTYVDENGKASWEAARLLSFDSRGRLYRAPGEVVADAYSVGRRWMAR